MLLIPFIAYTMITWTYSLICGQAIRSGTHPGMAQRPTHPTRRRVGLVGFFKGWVPKKPKIVPFHHFLQQTLLYFLLNLVFRYKYFILHNNLKE